MCDFNDGILILDIQAHKITAIVISNIKTAQARPNTNY